MWFWPLFHISHLSDKSPIMTIKSDAQQSLIIQIHLIAHFFFFPSNRAKKIHSCLPSLHFNHVSEVMVTCWILFSLSSRFQHSSSHWDMLRYFFCCSIIKQGEKGKEKRKNTSLNRFSRFTLTTDGFLKSFYLDINALLNMLQKTWSFQWKIARWTDSNAFWIWIVWKCFLLRWEMLLKNEKKIKTVGVAAD